MYTPTEFLDRGGRHVLYSQKSASPFINSTGKELREHRTIAKIILGSVMVLEQTTHLMLQMKVPNVK
jgi:hypothetical protein